MNISQLNAVGLPDRNGKHGDGYGQWFVPDLE